MTATMTETEVEPLEVALAEGRAVALPMTNGGVEYVDTDEADRIRALTVSANGAGYAQFGRGQFVHRLVAGAIKGQSVDHRNGDRLDNRKANLRIATQRQNSANRGIQSNNTTGYKGVSRNGNKYVAEVRVTQKRADGSRKWIAVHRSYHDDLLEAAAAYNEAAVQHQGEFAVLNDLA